ncbi:MAG: hypothetical protein R6V04_12430 [bacterium]
MKNYLKTFIISIIMHCILILILLTFKTKSPRNPDYLKFNLISEKQKKSLHKPKSESFDKNKKISKNKTNPSLKPIHIEDILNYETIKKKISTSVVDSSQYQPPILNNLISKKVISLNQYIRDKLKEDYPNQFSNQSKKPTPKKIELNADYICDKIEAKAFSFLFKKNNGTQIDIYKKYNFSDSITAAQLDAKLQKLVKMGFLFRKKISPQLPFTISALFIQIPIEMSKKNRDNPVYEYQPLINKENLITYLQAKLFRLKEKLKRSKTDSLQIKKNITSLQESIFILTQG